MAYKNLFVGMALLAVGVLVAGGNAYARRSLQFQDPAATATPTLQNVVEITPEVSTLAQPDAATVVESQAAAARPQAGIFRSLGLGRKRAEWETENGAPKDDGRWKVYKNGDFRVLYINDRVWHLSRIWTPNKAPHLAALRKTVSQRVPDDFQLVKSAALSEHLFVETYYSAGLATQFDAGTSWPGDRRPGTFLVMYHIDGGLAGGDVVTKLEIKAGNNPLVDNR